MSKTEEAVRALSELGLTEYEARCFVALTRISRGTARDVSEVADVPRSRVYDTIERLDRKGLVNVQQSDPREYQAVSVEKACERIRDDYDSRIHAAESALEQVERPQSSENEGMWAISRPEHVADRVATFLEQAEESVHLVVATDEVIDEDFLRRLRDVTERGTDVFVEVPTDGVRERFADAVPDATVVAASDLETTDVVHSARPARLLLVDRESVVATGTKTSNLPDVVQETAIWTYGRDHGFAAWVRELLDDRRVELERA
ncbi:TrmB family transcriptional regulator [Natrarchaeobius oligotrophus]|uniref:TrmB family transcriptional regulator n=1 Tax=Natrarchaeobius chitinivorans TaxID=1679083 RepID=A0A3N6MAI2_NATCH|nr:helix-turn-helix domain-containing protein [Natrarchaeobius chitinivorans]RQH00804.1 TrmB family transcriptional regulator [Natrarchaeobius chitinivorans]